MDHFSEVSKIIEHALTGNLDGVRAYGQLLADKLRSEGELRQAERIEFKLAGLPTDPNQCVVPMTQALALSTEPQPPMRPHR